MKKIILYFLSFTLLFVACEQVELEEVDPNNFEDATPDLMLKGPILAMDLVFEGELARLAGMWSGYFTGADRQYVSYNVYNVVAGDFDNIWGTLYADGIVPCRLIREKATAINNHEIQAISMIVEANLLGVAADLWNDVPNTQAGDADFPQPAYDSQASVYAHVIQLLQDAITMLNTHGLETSNKYASEVIHPSITALNWVEISNSLLARYYLHIGDYDNALVRAQAGISSSAGDFLFNHPSGSYPSNVSGAQNIYFDFLAWNRDGYMGAGDAHLVTVMSDRADQRIDWYYFEPGWWNNDWYPNCWNGGDGGWWSVDGIFDADQPFPFITYYETQLIIAECELLGTTVSPANALVALNNTRQYWDSKMDGLFGAGDYFADYLATDFATNADLLEEILIEKYISLYGQIEAFNDMRRTDNYIGIPLKTGTNLPERFIYSQSEINSNVNTPAAVDLFTPTQVNVGDYPGI